MKKIVLIVSIALVITACKEKVVKQIITEDSIELKDNKLIIGSSDVKDAYFQIDNKLLFLENGFSGADNYFFGDIKKWSTVHKNAPYSAANNFHYWTEGNGRNPNRVEFESNESPLQFYIEGIDEAWYGLQNGSNHLWSSGYDVSTSSSDWLWDNQFGLSSDWEMRLSHTDGNLETKGSIKTGAFLSLTPTSHKIVATNSIFINKEGILMFKDKSGKVFKIELVPSMN